MNFLKRFTRPNISKLEEAKDVKRLIDILGQEGDKEVLYSVVDALGRIGDSDAVSALVNASLVSTNMRKRVSDAIVNIRHLNQSKKLDYRAIKIALENENEIIHWQIVSLLEDLGDKQAIDILIDTLKSHSNEDIRKASQVALKRMDDPSIIKSLISILKEKETQINVALALGEIGNPIAIDPLIECLKANNKLIPYSDVLFMNFQDDAIQKLGVALHEFDDESVISIVLSLEKMGTQASTDLLISAYESLKSTVIRTQISKSLDALGISETESKIVQENHKTMSSKVESAYILVAFTSPFPKERHRDLFLTDRRILHETSSEFKFLSSNAYELNVQPTFKIVQSSVKATKEISQEWKDEQTTLISEFMRRTVNYSGISTNEIKQLIEDKRLFFVSNVDDIPIQYKAEGVVSPEDVGKYFYRLVAFYFEINDKVDPDISFLKTNRNVEGLVKALDNFRVREDAILALKEVGDARAVEALLDLLQYSEVEFIRAISARALANIGDTRVVDPLISLLQDNSESDFMRRCSAMNLGEIADERAVEPLISILALSNIHIVQEAIEALGKIGDKRAVEPIIMFLADESRDKSASSQYVAIGTLGKIGDAKAIEPLIALLSSTDMSIIRHSAYALGMIGYSRAIKPLSTLLQSQNLDERTKAACENAIQEIRSGGSSQQKKDEKEQLLQKQDVVLSNQNTSQDEDVIAREIKVWIDANIDYLGALAMAQFTKKGRGLILISSYEVGNGQPWSANLNFAYINRAYLDKLDEIEVKYITEYDPYSALVISFIRHDSKMKRTTLRSELPIIEMSLNNKDYEKRLTSQ